MFSLIFERKSPGRVCLFLLLLVLIFFFNPVLLQAEDADGGQLGQLYDLGLGAHVAGMGGAGVAMGNDISSLYYNPAATPFVNYSGANISQTELFVDTVFQTGSVLFNNRRWAFGLSYLQLGSDDFESYNREGDVLKSFDVGEKAYLLSGGYKLTSWLSVGMTANYFSQEIYKYSRSSSGFDGSIFLKPTDWWHLGFTAHNIVEPTLDDEVIPQQYRAGSSIWLWEDHIRFAVDMLMMDERSDRYFWGIEFFDKRDWPFERTLSLRAGQANKKLTVGASITMGPSFKFDYSIRDHDVDYIHQFGLNYFWDVYQSEDDGEQLEDEVETDMLPPLPILVSGVTAELESEQQEALKAENQRRIVLPPVGGDTAGEVQPPADTSSGSGMSEGVLTEPKTSPVSGTEKQAVDPSALDASDREDDKRKVEENKSGSLSNRQELQEKHTQIRQALNRGELDRASDLLREAHSIQPGHPENNRLQQSLERAYEQLPSYKKRSRKIYSEGLAHYVNGDYEQAIQSWYRCLELDPGYEAPRRAIERTRELIE